MPSMTAFSTIPRLILCCGLSLFTTGLCPALDAQSAPVNGLAAYWPFDETSGIIAHDESGNANDGTLECNGGCTPLPAWTAGRENGGLAFIAPQDFLSVPDAPSLRLAANFTITFWLKKPAGATNLSYVSKGADTRMSGFMLATGNPGSYIYLNLFNNGALTARCVGSGLIQDGVWEHLAVSYDGLQIRFYLNGQAGPACSATGLPGTGASPLLIGGFNRTNPDGNMDEVRIYNRALSAQEIVSVYNDPGDGAATVTVAVAPIGSNLSASQTLQFAATVTGSANTAVTWSVNAGDGSISSSGLYTAPASIPGTRPVTVTATSLTVPAVPGSAVITLTQGGSQFRTSNVTVMPGVNSATWKYWMALISATVGFPGSVASDPNWPGFKPQYMNQLVNQLGINTVQLTEASGDIENSYDCWTKSILIDNNVAEWRACRYAPVNDDSNPLRFNCANSNLINCSSSFPLSFFDATMSQYIAGPGGMRATVQGNGEAFHLIFQWIHWPLVSGYLDQNPAEVGEHILSVFEHSQNKFGFVPDIVDMMVEPDGAGSAVWTPAKLGASAAAVKSRLNAAGFYPQIWCCSVSETRVALNWYNGAKAAAGPNVINALTTHWYDGINTSWPAIDVQAKADGVPVVMTEFDASGMTDLYDIINSGNVSGFEKYGDATVSSTDNPNEYFMITNTSPYTSHYLGQVAGARSPTWFFPQYMHYVREGDVREASTSDNSCATPLAFRSPLGLDKIPVRLACTGDQTVKVRGMAAGTYGCTYTYSNAVLLQSCGANQIVGAGGELTASIAGIPLPPTGATTAVVTFYAIPPQ